MQGLYCTLQGRALAAAKRTQSLDSSAGGLNRNRRRHCAGFGVIWISQACRFLRLCVRALARFPRGDQDTRPCLRNFARSEGIRPLLSREKDRATRSRQVVCMQTRSCFRQYESGGSSIRKCHSGKSWLSAADQRAPSCFLCVLRSQRTTCSSIVAMSGYRCGCLATGMGTAAAWWCCPCMTPRLRRTIEFAR